MPPGDQTDELVERARAEGRDGADRGRDRVRGRRGRATSRAAGSEIDVRRSTGRERAGSSSWQSLARGTGAIETDYLNGEIVLLGRLHGVPTPVNAALCALAERYAREGGAPGEL